MGVKVRHQDFDDNGRVAVANGANGSGEMFGTTILEIVARNGGNHYVLQFQSFHRLRHPLRFVFFERERFGCRYRAESTSTRATLTSDHHRRCALAPAFPTVRALR